MSINGVGTIGYPYEKEVNSDTGLTIHTVINSEWIIDLKIKDEIKIFRKKERRKIPVS